MTENVFKHSGDLGDVIYSLPVIKSLGGGHLVLTPASYVREPFTPAKADRVASFFASQDYVKSVQFRTAVNPTYNLDDFRDVWTRLRRTGAHKPYSICELHLMTFKLPLRLAQEKWIDIEPMPGIDVVFSRSPRYRNSSFPWRKAYEKYYNAGDISVIYLGTREEAHNFNQEVGRIDWYPTPQLYDAARIVAGARLVVSNQNAIGAIAAATKRPWKQETWEAEPNCKFHNVLGEDDWPDL